MHWKTTLVLLVFTVGLGAYLSLYEIRQPSPEERGRIAREILDIPEESVTRVILKTPQADCTLSREGETWRLDPQHVPADAVRIERLLLELSPLMAERILTAPAGAPFDRHSFGLDPPAGTLTVTSGDTETTLVFGETTAVGDNRYLQVAGRPEVFVVSPALFELANRPADTLRAKADEAPGAQDALQDGDVREDRQEEQRPPEEVAPQGTP